MKYFPYFLFIWAKTSLIQFIQARHNPPNLSLNILKLVKTKVKVNQMAPLFGGKIL